MEKERKINITAEDARELALELAKAQKAVLSYSLTAKADEDGFDNTDALLLLESLQKAKGIFMSLGDFSERERYCL